MSPTNQPPKRRKNASKKTKKSWRKNTDVAAVEDFLEDQRLEERLGGAFQDRPDKDLFVVDKEAGGGAGGAEPDDGDKKLPQRLLRRKKLAEKSLKCFKNLEVTSGVKDPKKGRNRRMLPEERKNPVVREMERKMIEQGVVKAKEKQARQNRKAQKEAKVATELDRATRRRTKFDFDLWNDTKPDRDAVEINSDPWLTPTTKRHNLKNLNKLELKAPKDFLDKPSIACPVEVPHGGASYNPSYKDHQDLLWKAAITEINKEKALQKIEFHTTRMFPDAKNAPTEETWLKEMSEGLKTLDEEEEEEEEDEKEEENGFGAEKATAKLKTRKQRRDEKARKAEARKLKYVKSDKQMNQDIYRLRTMKKMISAQERLTLERSKQKKLSAALKKGQAATLSGHAFEEAELSIKLSDELTGNLRSLKPEGNLLLDRYKSMQKRNIIETRVKHKVQRKNHKRKKLEKRSYKMPFDKQEPRKV